MVNNLSFYTVFNTTISCTCDFAYEVRKDGGRCPKYDTVPNDNNCDVWVTYFSKFHCNKILGHGFGPCRAIATLINLRFSEKNEGFSGLLFFLLNQELNIMPTPLFSIFVD